MTRYTNYKLTIADVLPGDHQWTFLLEHRCRLQETDISFPA